MLSYINLSHSNGLLVRSNPLPDNESCKSMTEEVRIFSQAFICIKYNQLQPIT